MRLKWACLLFVFFGVRSVLTAQQSGTVDFNSGWKFYLGDDSLANAAKYNDNQWRRLELPHDWSIEGAFDRNSKATTQGGALPGGVGWYRKSFLLSPAQKAKRIFIQFDGVYRNSRVWMNGHELGQRPNGYISFEYELTPFLKQDGENTIAVRVDNSAQPNSRWYSGSGIYRNVHLVSRDKIIAVQQWGTAVLTKMKDDGSTNVEVHAKMAGSGNTRKQIFVQTSIVDEKGKVISSNKQKLDTKRDLSTGTSLVFTSTIPKPALWSVTHPHQYKAEVKIFVGDKLVDQYITKFGICYFHFDKDKGFFLNGQPLKILGVCMHHDLGALGASVNEAAMRRQLKILKEMGCNAIRTSHNPAAPEFLNLCDEMGFLVMEEAFDMWVKKKNRYDYALDFKTWYQRDLEDMILRDRNHPSIFMWSVGNEIREQFDSSGISITKELVQLIKSIDTSRPVTAALSEWDPSKNYLYKSGALDVVGLNYHHEVYQDFATYFPGQIFLGTENMSALATRGSYHFPADSIYRWPQRSPQKYVENGFADYTVSAFDQVSAYWGSTHEETWKIIKAHENLSGLFVWTGFDYLGEPTPYPWPARSSYFGIVDLAGFPKDVYYMYQSEWTKKPMLHLLPHWNWERGQLIDVWAYYNEADEVELFLNGRSLGIRKKNGDDLHVQWKVSFERGTLKAVSRKNGKTICTASVATASAPVKIELVADKKILQPDGKDIAFVTVRLLDAQGNLVPDADKKIRFSINGTATIAGSDNGYQADTTSLSLPVRNTWKGLCVVLVKAGHKKGNSTLKAFAEGLKPAEISLQTGGGTADK